MPTGLIAIPPAPESPIGSTVLVDAWYPAISVESLRAALRLRGDVPHARLVAAIEGAVLTITGELVDWQAARIAEGHASLAAIDAASVINGQSRLTLLFTRAVRCAAAAELGDLARDASATLDAAQRLDDEAGVSASLHRMAILAVRDMLGVTRTAVALI